MTPADPRRGARERPSRRALLRGAAAGGAGLAAASLARPASAGRTLAPPVAFQLEAHLATTPPFADGVQLTLHRLRHLAGGPTRGLLPLLEATEGAAVTVQVQNHLPIPIRPSVVGVADGARVRPGASGTLAFTMPPAGTYLLTHAEARRGALPGGMTQLDPVRPSAGLAAAVISRPASGAQVLYDGGPAYDREYVLLYEDFDDRAAAHHASATSSGFTPYEPNYFTVNGLAYPDLPNDPDSRVAGSLGERILLRLLNAGRMRQSIHFHGFHPEPVARDAQPETVLPPKDTFGLPSRSTLDLVLTAHQSGLYPLHPHSLTAVTANGFYPFGQLTLIDIA